MQKITLVFLFLTLTATSWNAAAERDSSTASNASSESTAIESTPKAEQSNALYLELGGPGLLYSVNYERFLMPKLSVRAGLSFFMLSENGTPEKVYFEFAPLGVQYFFFEGNHKLEVGMVGIIGAGQTGLNQAPGVIDHAFLWGVAGTVGYRYQPEDSHLLLRATFTPIYLPPLDRLVNLTILPSIGMSGGFTF